MDIRMCHAGMIAAAMIVALATPAAAQTKINVGTNPTLSDGPLHIAREKGYFKDAGLEVEIVEFPSPAQMVALAAKGDLPIIGTAIAASYFNSLAQGLPLKIIADRAQHPAHHNLMVRADLRETLKKPADLKGRTIAVSIRGSLVEYETGRILESAGLTIKDVEIKYIPFTQTAVAFQNKAVDAAILVPPFVELIEGQKFAYRWIDPAEVINRLQISGWIVNSEWAAKNQETVRNFVAGWLRGARDYHMAMNGGPNRAEVVAILARTTNIKDPAMYDRMKWISVNPNGEVFADGLLDVQDWFHRNGLIERKFTIEELIDRSYADWAVGRLGRFDR